MVFVVYSIFLVTIPYMWFKKERIHGANVIDSKDFNPSMTEYIKVLTIC